jgi:1-acyl-sn-glycerol-3-phosphate acyltransferase
MFDKIVWYLARLLINFIGMEKLKKIPHQGPLLIAMNHINFLEAPLWYFLFKPRKVWALAKAELWENPFYGVFVRKWGGLKINRGRADKATFDMVDRMMKKNHMVAIAPEGTRSKNGILRRGKPGVVLMSRMLDVPILPVVHWGGQNFWKNLLHLRRTDFHIEVGEPYRLNGDPHNREDRKAMTEKVMRSMAELLPLELRGPYK